MLVYILIAIIVVLIIFIFVLWSRVQKLGKQRHYISERNMGAMKDSYIENIEAVLSPHLFKNILNSVQSHAFQTYFALDKLANILDYILYESKNGYVSPKEEIEFAKDLIEINRIKLSPLFELTIKLKIDETSYLYTQKKLVPLISIDLIENAFKHADFQSSGAYISIVFEFQNNVFALTVSNKISQKTSLKKEKSGIGNMTIEERLKKFYPNRYKLEKIINDDIFTSHLKIDLNESKDKMRSS